ncbi:MAG: caspase family protein [Piscinibacter sp.]|nr:caspase family protein [Piscinibacter sp.]
MRRRRLLQGGAGAALGVTLPLAAQRVPSGQALLVGNTSYNPSDENLPPARKCIADLEVRLSRMGFATVALHDPPVAQVQAELDKLQRTIGANPGLAGVFYFVGHGFQSNAENFLVPAGGNLQSAPAQLARSCLSLEREVFTRLSRPAGPAATVIMVDACRTPDRPRSPTEGYNQTMPPDGCHVVFATGPGKRAFAPNDPQRYTLFAEALMSELDVTDPSRSIFLTLETVRVKVARKVNSIEGIVKAFGRNAQEPEVASNVSGDPKWIASAAPASAPKPEAAPAAAELEAARSTASPEEAIGKLKALVQKLPEGEQADIAQVRIGDLEKVVSAARQARLNLDVSALTAQLTPRLAEDAQRAVRGDKYAAMRVAESLPQPASGTLIERSDRGRWMIFAAYLGNGIAAYQLSEHFRNVDRRDAEASRYLNLARANNYTPPRQLETRR